MPGVAMGIAFFAVTILPTSNVVSTDMMTLLSERFLYVPLLGLVFAGAALAMRVTAQQARRAVIAAASTAAVAFAFVAARRAADFQDEERFWARELALHPESLEAQRYQIDREVKRKRFQKALTLAARAQATAAREYPQSGLELDFMVQGVQVLLSLLPDHNAKALRAVDDFLAAISSGTASTLDMGALHMQLPAGNPRFAKRIDKQRPRFDALRAGIKSRLSDDATALELAGEARALCPGCSDVGRAAAIVAAIADRFDAAERTIDSVARFTGESAVAETRKMLRSAVRANEQAASTTIEAARLQLRATAFCELEAWGRAYDVLAPARAEIEQASEFAPGFAELAWRAGEFRTAREVLAKWMPPDAAERTTRGWSIKMGWIDPDEGPTKAASAHLPEER
jgi:hypothetical protein